jgi:hypothetical protein
MGLLKRICPHLFGWNVIPSGGRRFCRVCAYQQRWDEERQEWVPAETEEE